MSVIKPAMPAKEPSEEGKAPPPTPPEVLDRVLNIPMDLTVVLAETTMSLKDVVGLTQGIILEFQKTVDQPLELRIHNKKIAAGEAVKIGEKFGLQVTQIGTPRETAKLLGGR